MKALFRKTLHGLAPGDPQAEEMLSKWKLGDQIMVEARKPRNPYHHRLAMACAQLVVENTDRYKNIDHFLAAAKVYAGHCDRFETAKGEVVLVPKSISFASMDQTEFGPFFDKMIELACKVLSVDAPTMVDEINAMAA